MNISSDSEKYISDITPLLVAKNIETISPALYNVLEELLKNKAKIGISGAMLLNMLDSRLSIWAAKTGIALRAAGLKKTVIVTFCEF